MKRALECTGGTAAVEAAIFLPIFMLLTLGITDLGSAMFMRQQVNAAAQAGAMYAVGHSAAGLTCATMNGACLSAIQTAMNDASGHPTFCTPTGACTASIAACADAPTTNCVIVSANYSLTSILPSSAYTWAQAMSTSYTVTIRIS